jgi:hypothetical protein
MKKVFYALTIASALMLTSEMVTAQSWEKNSKVFSVGVGASQFYHLDNFYYSDSRNFNHWYSPVTLQFNIQGEFGIHKYVGIGFTTGFGGRGRR